MTRLMRVEEYCQQRFTPGSRPSRKTVIRWIQNGHVPGKQIGTFWFVDADAETASTGNPTLDSVLEYK